MAKDKKPARPPRGQQPPSLHFFDPVDEPPLGEERPDVTEPPLGSLDSFDDSELTPPVQEQELPTTQVAIDELLAANERLGAATTMLRGELDQARIEAATGAQEVTRVTALLETQTGLIEAAERKLIEALDRTSDVEQRLLASELRANDLDSECALLRENLLSMESRLSMKRLWQVLTKTSTEQKIYIAALNVTDAIHLALREKIVETADAITNVVMVKVDKLVI